METQTTPEKKPIAHGTSEDKTHTYRTTDKALYHASHRRNVLRCFTEEQRAGFKPPTVCPSFVIRRAVEVPVNNPKPGEPQTRLTAWRKPFRGWKKRTRVAFKRNIRERVKAEMQARVANARANATQTGNTIRGAEMLAAQTGEDARA